MATFSKPVVRYVIQVEGVPVRCAVTLGDVEVTPFARRTGPGQCGERTQGAQQRRSLYADASFAKWHAR